MYHEGYPNTLCTQQEITLLKAGILEGCIMMIKFALWQEQAYGLTLKKKTPWP
jgi:hypothetical protein